MSRGMGITVRRMVEAARTDAAMVAEKRGNLEFARERARNATLSWEGGMISRAEERGARLASITAELELLLAKLQCETAILDLELATGQTFPR
jgi:outer membrane protein TolC